MPGIFLLVISGVLEFFIVPPGAVAPRPGLTMGRFHMAAEPAPMRIIVLRSESDAAAGKRRRRGGNGSSAAE